MNCEASRKLMEVCRPDSSDLGDPELRDLAGHLERCPECRALLEANAENDRRLGRAMRDVPVPADLKERLLVALERPRAPSRVVDRPPRRRRRFGRRAVWLGTGMTGVAAAAAVAAVLVVMPPGRHVVTYAEVHRWEAHWGFAELARARWRTLEPADIEDREAVDERVWDELRLEALPPAALPLRSIDGFAVGRFLEQDVAVLRYRLSGGRKVYVYALPAVGFQVEVGSDPASDLVATQGLVASCWREGEFLYVLVHRGEKEALERELQITLPPALASR